MIVDVQFNPARWTWPQIRDMALAAEADGFDTVWVLDHLSGQAVGGDRMLECFTLAGALAAVTTTIGVGTMVANAANRHPALLGVAAASVQEISGGRFRFGIGAGASPGSWWAREHEVAGIELAPTQEERHQRMLEVLEVCREMWAAERDPKWDGFPRADPVPPVFVGVNSVALAVAAEPVCDGINVRWSHPAALAILDAAARARAGSGRAATPLSLGTWAFYSNETADPDGEFQATLAAVGVDRLMLVR
jgi:alkanesulfonate monooxygenase SsuD/methylene tetrahydromethanopterin reductase-like flavin-dependent oxidoreductase (luciferase family)